MVSVLLALIGVSIVVAVVISGDHAPVWLARLVVAEVVVVIIDFIVVMVSVNSDV